MSSSSSNVNKILNSKNYTFSGKWNMFVFKKILTKPIIERSCLLIHLFLFLKYDHILD